MVEDDDDGQPGTGTDTPQKVVKKRKSKATADGGEKPPPKKRGRKVAGEVL